MFQELWTPRAAIEIVALYALCYTILKFIRGTRAAALLKASIFILIISIIGVLFIAENLKLFHLKQMLEIILSGSFIVLIVIFAPEMRRALLKLSQSPLLSPMFTPSSNAIVREIGEAVETFSQKRVGALLVIEGEVGLSEYTEGRSRIDANVTAELIETLFYPGSPTHDGAVIIQHDRITAAGCLLPLTDDPALARSVGTRHRAAIGVTEETDAISIAVSEETGAISLCSGGRIQSGLDRAKLEETLRELYNNRKEGKPIRTRGNGKEGERT